MKIEMFSVIFAWEALSGSELNCELSRSDASFAFVGSKSAKVLPYSW